VTSGSEVAITPSQQARERQLIAVLDRQEPIESLLALIYSLNPQPQPVPLQDTAIALDANVFLRLSAHAKSADIIDYLGSAHNAPLILPGQVIQEFWNNQFQAVDSVAAGLKKRFEQLKSDISLIDTAFGEYAERFEKLVEEFNDDYGYAYDEGTIRKTRALLEVLRQKAVVPYASRMLFSEIAAQRKKTKTPPGFRDVGDGDFYVWVDLLTGIQQARASGQSFSRVVLVSHDRKIDWMREGVAHPILISEVQALVGAPFEIWSIKRLADEIASVT
jgi:hypothetical protein